MFSTLVYLSLVMMTSGLPMFDRLNPDTQPESRSSSEKFNGTLALLSRLLDAKQRAEIFILHQAVFGHLPPEYTIQLDPCSFGTCIKGFSPFKIPSSLLLNGDACACVEEKDVPYIWAMYELGSTGVKSYKEISNDKTYGKGSYKRSSVLEPLNKDVTLTYVPPPDTDITPELLSESLAVQPQNTATVASVLPHFQNGVISYGIQLNGFVAATMLLNASTDLPCNTIGDLVQPDIELRPKETKNSTGAPIIPDCTIIAVNMYSPNVINYWIQNKEGSIFSLARSNKVVDVDKFNSTASTDLVHRATLSDRTKRDLSMHDCNMAGHGILTRAKGKRAISQLDIHTAVMTQQACSAITCINNGGTPAVFNPFTKSCGCRDPIYIEIDHSS